MISGSDTVDVLMSRVKVASDAEDYALASGFSMPS